MTEGLRRLLVSLVVLTVVAGGVAAGQVPAPDPLTAAKDLYAGASYAEALAALDNLKDSKPTGDRALEIEKYRAFCLFAAGRQDEAEQVMAAIVKEHPLSTLPEQEVSPRVLAVFREVRKRVLPEAVRGVYRRGAEAFHDKSMTEAGEQLTLVVRLLEDPDLADLPDRRDLDALAKGFLALVAAATAPLPATPAVRTTSLPTPQVRDLYSRDDQGATPPVPIETPAPAWPTGIPKMGGTGILEVTVDEAGRVTKVAVLQSLNRMYDGLLVEAARGWRYEPARVGSRPVKYVLHVPVQLSGRQP